MRFCKPRNCTIERNMNFREKILLAINNKEAEKIIQEQIKDVYEVVGVVSYKDAVPSALLLSSSSRHTFN